MLFSIERPDPWRHAPPMPQPWGSSSFPAALAQRAALGFASHPGKGQAEGNTAQKKKKVAGKERTRFRSFGTLGTFSATRRKAPLKKLVSIFVGGEKLVTRNGERRCWFFWLGGAIGRE